MVRPVGVEEQSDDHRHRGGDQRHPQVLHDRDHAIVTAEFTGDRDEAGRAAGHQRQRSGQRADIAMQPEQRTGDDAEHQRGDRDGDHDRPIRPESAHRVAVNHGADVDAEHTLRGNAGRAGHPFGSERRQRQRDADDQRREQRSGRHADDGQRNGDGDGKTTSNAHLAICCSRFLVTKTSMPLALFTCNTAF